MISATKKNKIIEQHEAEKEDSFFTNKITFYNDYSWNLILPS